MAGGRATTLGKLDDRVVVVTGAGASGEGIGNGKACAIHYAREGARVVAVDINENALAETGNILTEEGNSPSQGFPCGGGRGERRFTLSQVHPAT